MCLFSCLGGRRDLHSFPTRRSSDLPPAVRAAHRRCGAATVLPEARRGRAVGCPAASPRSEEHTSELQSRLHLVCRLLLEKKKIDADPPRNTLKLHNSAPAHALAVPY